MNNSHIEMSEAVKNTSDSSYSLGNLVDNSTLYLRIEKLEARVRQLELQFQRGDQLDPENCQSLEDQILFQKSRTTIVASSSVADTCSVLKSLICTSKLARAQCIWLIIVLTCFTIYAVKGFQEANQNEHSQWKPQRMIASKDYGVAEYGQYSMPFFYIEFWITELASDFRNDGCSADNIEENIASCVANRSWTEQEMMDTFSAIWGVHPTWECNDACLASVDLNQLSQKMILGCEYTTDSRDGDTFNISEVAFGVLNPLITDWENVFIGYIGFKPQDPEPGYLWECSFEFDPIDIADETLLVNSYKLRINNDDNTDFFSNDASSIELDIKNLLSEDYHGNVF